MQARTQVTELRLEIDAGVRELVRAFVREASLAQDIPSVVASHMAEGAGDVWRELCGHRGIGQRAHLSVQVRKEEVVFRIAITGHDKFVSFMPSLFTGLPADLGFSYREHGVDGWEILLHTSIEPSPPAMVLEGEGEDETGVTEVFQVEPPREDDSPAIARCFLQVYGHHYIHPEVFNPRRYWSKVQSGELIPIVARNAAGEVVGHVALEREPGSQVAERGQAVVLPSYRGHHLLEMMTERLTEQARKIGLVGIFAQPVTVHIFSQRNDDRAGMPICAAMLGIRPENALPKGLPVPTRGQRQSLLLAYRFLNAPGDRRFYEPSIYRDVVSQISERIDINPKFSGAKGAAAQNSSIHVKLDKNGSAHISVDQIGAEIAIELKLTFTNLISLGAEYLQLAAPLSDPGISLLVDAARSMGFYFCGMGPAFFSSGDALLLQYAAQPVDVSKLQIFSDHAKALVSFIENDRCTVGQ